MDILSEHALSLQAATEEPLLRLDRRKCHISTIWRWATKGLRGVRLEYVRLGGRVYTSREALNRFFNALAAADRAEDSSPIEREAAQCRTPVTTGKPRSAKQRADAIARARKELAAVGI